MLAMKDERGKMGEIAGKVVLITGAGRGSGYLLVKTFAERSAIVAANDISPINVEKVVEEINQQGGGAIMNLVTASTRDGKFEAAFVASMNGLNGFARQAARELSPHGIKVYGVANTGHTITEKVFALLEEFA